MKIYLIDEKFDMVWLRQAEGKLEQVLGNIKIIPVKSWSQILKVVTVGASTAVACRQAAATIITVAELDSECFGCS